MAPGGVAACKQQPTIAMAFKVKDTAAFAKGRPEQTRHAPKAQSAKC